MGNRSPPWQRGTRCDIGLPMGGPIPEGGGLMATSTQFEKALLILAEGQAEQGERLGRLEEAILALVSTKVEGEAKAVRPSRTSRRTTKVEAPKGRSTRSTTKRTSSTESSSVRYEVTVASRSNARLANDEDLAEVTAVLGLRRSPSTFGALLDEVLDYNAAAREAGKATLSIQALVNGKPLDRATSQRLRRLG